MEISAGRFLLAVVLLPKFPFTAPELRGGGGGGGRLVGGGGLGGGGGLLLIFLAGGGGGGFRGKLLLLGKPPDAGVGNTMIVVDVMEISLYFLLFC